LEQSEEDMKKGIIFFLLVLSFPVFSQVGNPGKLEQRLQRLNWDMQLGTAFIYSPVWGSGMNYYAAPGFSMPLTKNFSFHGGVVTSVTTSPYMASPESGMQRSTSGSTSVYGTVAYRLNQNVTFYGTGVKNLVNFGPPTPFNYNSYDEISFGSTIKLGNNVTIGASVHFREYTHPGTGYYSPWFDRNY
jgi:hypothetical protein